MGPPNPLGLTAHHITASVLDLERAIDRYQEMLGFKLVERGSRNHGAFHFAELAIENFGVALVRFNDAATTRSPDGLLAPSWLHSFSPWPTLIAHTCCSSSAEPT